MCVVWLQLLFSKAAFVWAKMLFYIYIYICQTVLVLIQFYLSHLHSCSRDLFFCSFCEVNLHIHVAYFHCENHLSMAHSLYLNSLSVMKGKTDVFTVLSFLFFWLAPSLARLYSWIVYIPVASLSVSSSLAHISSPVTPFFQFSLVLLLPSLSLSLLTFPPPFFSFSILLSLSPSERLRIPKGADAIKMLILSVYRERERGGLTA